MKNIKTKNAPAAQPKIEPNTAYGPMIILNPGAKFTFQFGAAKAKMILDNLDTVKKFVEQYGK